MPDLLIEPEQPIVQTLRYETDVLRAHDGTEQRIATRQKPRCTIEFTTFLTENDDINSVRADLFQSASATWRIPLWWEWDRVTSAVGSASDTWPGDFAFSDLVAGDTVYIADPSGSPTVIDTLSSVSAGQIVTTSTAGSNFAAGSKVYRLASAKLREPTRLLRLREFGAELSIVADIESPRVAGGGNVTVATHAGIALLDPRPVAPEGLEEEFSLGAERVDFGGVWSQFSRVDPAFIGAERGYIIQSREDRQSWEAFLDHVKGRREPFLVPTFRPDLTLDSQPSVGSSTIDVTNDNYRGGWWLGPSSHQHLRIQTAAGEIYREVTAATGSGPYTLTIDPALPASVDGSTIAQISFLELCRLGSDEVRFEHYSTHSRVSVTTVVVQQ